MPGKRGVGARLIRPPVFTPDSSGNGCCVVEDCPWLNSVRTFHKNGVINIYIHFQFHTAFVVGYRNHIFFIFFKFR